MSSSVAKVENLLARNLDAERAVLGSILVDPRIMALVRKIVGHDDFSTERFRSFFRAMQALDDRDTHIDLITIVEWLKEYNLDRDGKAGQILTNIADEVSTSVGAEHHARIVREYSLRRQASNFLENGIQRLAQGDPAEVLSDIESGLRDLKGKEDQPDPARRFHFQPVSELDPKPPDWLVDRFIEKDTTGQGFGDSASAKTFLATDVACSVSTGKDFHGSKVYQGPVLFILAEGKGGIARRFRAWEIRHRVSLKGAPLYLSSSSAAFLDPEATRAVYDAAEEIALKEGGISLVIIDTLAKNFGPGDESKTADMNEYIRAVEHFRARYGSCVLSIHHPGLGDKTRGRGSNALFGGVDFSFSVDKDENRVVRIAFGKVRDGDLPEPRAFVLRTVELDLQDDEGRPVTSAVLDPTTFEARPSGTGSRLGENQTTALDALKELEERHQSNRREAGLDPSMARVSEQDWRGACYRAGLDRKQFTRARNSLKERRLISLNQGFVSSFSGGG